MSIRQYNLGSIVKPGFNPLGVQTTTTFYNLYSWGINTNGGLGLGNTTSYSSPKQVGLLTDWYNFADSYLWTISTKTDGTLWSWGRGSQGKLGFGNVTNYSSPKQVGSLTNWLTTTAGTNFSWAIKTDGTFWAVGGRNSVGQAGLGNTTYYSSPKQVGSLTTWSKLSKTGVGSESCFALG